MNLNLEKNLADILTKCSSHLDDGLEHSVKMLAKVF